MTYRGETEFAKSGKRKVVDGADNSIAATVHDYTNSNPLAVTLKDTSGDYVDASSIAASVQVTDGTDVLDILPDDAAYAASSNGILILGHDVEGAKFLPLRMDSVGHVMTHVMNPAHETLEFVTLDYDTAGGTANVSALGVCIPASGGAVAAGHSAQPLRVDPTGTTTQPVSGTVTANLGATDNAVIDDIAESTDFIDKTYLTEATTSTASGDVSIATAIASNYQYIKKVIVCNRDDADMDVSLQEESSATDIVPPMTLPAFGGRLHIDFAGRGLKLPTVNKDLQANITNAGADPKWTAYVEFYQSTS